MSYVFDTNVFVTLFTNFYPSTFVSLWEKFDLLVGAGEVVSTREVMREIEGQDDDLLAWTKENAEIFAIPNAEEGQFVSSIFSVPHFQANIEQQKIWKGGKNADPFVIAKAAVDGRRVVTLERRKPNSAKIPNICEHFEIECLNFEEFMQMENWKF